MITLGPYYISERVVTFGRQAFPKNGQFVVMVGGPGVGKGFVLDKIVPIHGKVFNSDDAIKTVAEFLNKGRKEDTGFIEKAKEVLDKDTVNLKSSEDVRKLYQVLKPIYNRYLLNFIQLLDSKNKPNIIIDGTGQSIKKKIIPNLDLIKKAGYTTTLIWVVTEKEIAWSRNLARARVVPRDVFDAIHAKIPSIVKQVENEFDNVWYVDASYSEPNWWIKHPESVLKVK